MNDFRTLCQSRRSIRKFTDQPVEPEKISYILQCGLLSPSAKRLNPWEFTVITNPDQIHRLAAAKTYGAQMMATATAAIVIALDASLTDTWMADGAIAAQNMMLAAEEQGLGSCWCHIYGREDSEQIVKEAAQIPSNLTVLCVLALGYKDEQRKVRTLEDLPYNKVHYINA